MAKCRLFKLKIQFSLLQYQPKSHAKTISARFNDHANGTPTNCRSWIRCRATMRTCCRRAEVGGGCDFVHTNSIPLSSVRICIFSPPRRSPHIATTIQRKSASSKRKSTKSSLLQFTAATWAGISWLRQLQTAKQHRSESLASQN